MPVLSLGNQALTGIFQKDGSTVKRAPLDLVLCMGDCGLLQLRDAVPRTDVFGPTYGYESSINATMRDHLRDIVRQAQRHVPLNPGDVVLDIGANDGTLLDNYPATTRRVGIDPSAARFEHNYRDKELIVDFFSRKTFPRKAKIITSIAMFYDLEDPLAFMRDIEACLAPGGIWVTEQGYMPAMLRNTAYDTVCHEHIEYYGLTQIIWLADRASLKVIGVTLNDINGGSFCVTLARKGAHHRANDDAIRELLAYEDILDESDYRRFAAHVAGHRDWLREFMCAHPDKLVLGYGASTKGNVILQYCGIELKAIAERNPAKFGLRTPGTNIPIISEAEARAMRPDYFLVLPWHFRREIEERERAFTAAGGKLLFPLEVKP